MGKIQYEYMDRIENVFYIREESYYVSPKGKKHRRCLFKCFCGEKFITILDCVRKKETTSCGCRQLRLARERLLKHGLSKSKIYMSWRHMKERCDNPNDIKFKDYGSRGIKYCEKWKSFIGFYEDMGNSYVHGLQIDRINNDDNYYKENCRWAKRNLQCHNRRKNKKCSSIYKGVSRQTGTEKWLAYITKGNRIHLGTFNTEKEAAIVYNKKALELYGKDACFNLVK